MSRVQALLCSRSRSMADDTIFPVPARLEELPPFRVGDRISGYYQLRSVLGRGGMSLVFEADDTMLSRRVAIKVVDDPQLGAEMLVNEAKALAAVRHPGLPIVYGLGVHRGWTYLVMERLYGVTLEEHLDGRGRMRRMDLDEGLATLLAIADVLATVHASGMAHRDLKPSNVMMCQGGRVALLDFGIMLPEVTARHFPRCGTPRYLAPELIDGNVVPGQAHLVDIYALGAMAFEMFAGRPVFDAGTLLQLLEHHVRTPPPALAELRPDLPPAVCELIASCLAKQPHERPHDMQAIAWELRSLRRRSAEQSGPIRTSAPVRSPRETYRRAQTDPAMSATSLPWDVLIVEDDADIRDGLASVLKSRGFRTRVAADGSDALDLIRRRGWRPSVILLDMNMPVMDGRQFLESQAGDPCLDGIPVLLVTAQPPADADRYASVRGVVPKPLDLSALLALLGSVCRPHADATR